jgi:Rieske Fe-S protein
MTDSTSPDSGSTTGPGSGAVAPSRRTVLAGAAAVGAVASTGVLAGCADDNTPTAGVPTAGESRPAGTITQTSEVPVGGGKVVVLADSKVVVTQPTEGTFKAFSAICTHAGCTVGGVTDGVIRCPCHGSEFDVATGEVLRGHDGTDPSNQAPLAVVDIAVEGDDVTFA